MDNLCNTTTKMQRRDWSNTYANDVSDHRHMLIAHERIRIDFT